MGYCSYPPFDIEDLLGKISAHCRPDESPVEGPSRAPILGVSGSMRDVEATLQQIAAHSSHTVITCESGVGKKVVAKRLHALAFSGQERPFIAVDCGAASQSRLESERFGHERGAFTGAVRARRGVFEQAGGDTLFFDEIANMSLTMQMKLLRVLQDRLVTRAGGEQLREVDFRLMCATNRDLKPLVHWGEFREAIFYRINVVHIDVPRCASGTRTSSGWPIGSSRRTTRPIPRRPGSGALPRRSPWCTIRSRATCASSSTASSERG